MNDLTWSDDSLKSIDGVKNYALTFRYRFMVKKRKDMTDKEQMELTQIHHKESAAKAGLYELTNEDCSKLRVQHGYLSEVVGKQEQRKVLFCFNSGIKFKDIPVVNRKGNTVSDYISEEKEILIEVKTSVRPYNSKSPVKILTKKLMMRLNTVQKKQIINIKDTAVLLDYCFHILEVLLMNVWLHTQWTRKMG